MGFITYWRRSRLDKKPFPGDWEQVMDRCIQPYRCLSPDKKKKLQKLVRYFLAEKSFEGCGGMELGETEQLIIAALACIPLLGGVSDLYPYLRAVLIYPDRYHAPYSDAGEDGVVTEGVESRMGESWDQGVIVLSWKEVNRDLKHPRDGANIVYHECAHQLDYEWGATMENFSWLQSGKDPGMAATLKEEYHQFVDALSSNRRVWVDDYAGENIHEFFAVMTENWFERPQLLKKAYPKVYRVLADFYNLESDFL